MKQEVVQDFLNLPGIAGLALMDGRSRPYFLGLDQGLNFQQKEALSQGLQQVLETTPEGFEAFEFWFAAYNVYIYKLDLGTILLVLTNQELEASRYHHTMAQLQETLRTDITKAVATFRLFAGTISLSQQEYWRTEHLSPAAPTPTLPPPNHVITWPEAIAALNTMSQFAMQFLGKSVVANYWKSSRPAAPWLAAIVIDREGTLAIGPGGAITAETPFSFEHHTTLQAWVTAFAQRCKLVMRDFLPLLEKQALTPRQAEILLIAPNSS